MSNDTAPRNFLLYRYLLTAGDAVQGDWIKGISSHQDADNKRQELMCGILDSLHEKTENDDIRFWKEPGTVKGDYLFRVQRITSVTVEQKFTDYNVPHEPSAWVAIDTDRNGQTIAIETGRQVSPKAIVNKLTAILQPYFKNIGLVLNVMEISQKGSFWKFVEENEEQINEVVFTIVPPNMAGLTSTLARQLSEFAGGTNSKSSKLTIKGQRNRGLSLKRSNRKLVGIVHQVENGAGDYAFKLKKSRRYQKPSDIQESVVAAPKQDRNLLPVELNDPNIAIIEKMKHEYRIKRKQ